MSGDDEGADWETSFEAGKQRLERDLGRKLTEAEAEELRNELPYVTDGDLDVKAAWESGPGRDGDKYDQSTHAGRVRYMAERGLDEEAARAPKPETIVCPPDDAPHSERVKFMAARAARAQVVESPAESDPAEQGGGLR